MCLIDADLQNQREDSHRLYREIQSSNVDLVQGTRDSSGRLRDGSYALSVGINRLLNLSFGTRARDNKSGFILCRRDVLAEILRHRHRYHYFHTFVRVAAQARGYSIREVESLFETRIRYRDLLVEQRLPGAILFRYLPAPRFHPRVMPEIVAEFRRHLGAVLRVTEEPVESIDSSTRRSAASSTRERRATSEPGRQ